MKLFARLVAAVLAFAILGGLGVVACSRGIERVAVPEGVPPGVGAALPPLDINAPGRSANQLAEWADARAGELGMSATALSAYGYAAAVMAETRPTCGIGWTTVAGIASVESKHGTHRGAKVAPNGQVAPAIRGVPLDGSPGVAKILDTDRGTFDGDTVHDRAMGPLQFIPETWKRWGVDANGDGVADPDNIDDAALTAARYLCVSGGDLTTGEGWTKALLTYNHSSAYLQEVRNRAAAYSVGVRPD